MVNADQAVKDQGLSMGGNMTAVQGLSTELGAFIAGVMLSTTEQQESALVQLEHIKGFFISLFIASTGLVMSPQFLMQHLRVLAGGVALTILAKTTLVRALLPMSWDVDCTYILGPQN